MTSSARRRLALRPCLVGHPIFSARVESPKTPAFSLPFHRRQICFHSRDIVLGLGQRRISYHTWDKFVPDCSSTSQRPAEGRRPYSSLPPNLSGALLQVRQEEECLLAGIAVVKIHAENPQAQIGHKNVGVLRVMYGQDSSGMIAVSGAWAMSINTAPGPWSLYSFSASAPKCARCQIELLPLQPAAVGKRRIGHQVYLRSTCEVCWFSEANGTDSSAQPIRSDSASVPCWPSLSVLGIRLSEAACRESLKSQELYCHQRRRDQCPTSPHAASMCRPPER